MSSDDIKERVSNLFSTIISPLSCSLRYESQEIILHQDSLACRLYGNIKITEQFNCNYSLNEHYKESFQNSALRPVGVNLAGDVRVIELSDHPFYLAMLFQPQLAAPNSLGHPVIKEFLKASQSHKKYKQEKNHQ